MELASRNCYHWFRNIIASGANTLSVEPPGPLHDPNEIHQNRAAVEPSFWIILNGMLRGAWRKHTVSASWKRGFLAGFWIEVFFQLHPPCWLVATNLGCDFRSNESQWIETAVLIHPMQHWSSTTHAEFGHKHNILVSWPLPFDFKLIGYPKLKCKGCYWRAVHLLPQVCSFQSVTPGLKRWKMRNTSATSDVIWHQAFCWEIPATLPKRHQLFLFWICEGWHINSESVRNIWDQYVKGSLVM